MAEPKIYTARQILIDGRLTENAGVTIESDRFLKIEMDLRSHRTKSLFDFDDAILAPGFVDLQVNGCSGAIFIRNIDAVTLERMHEGNLRHGVTSFLPTLVSTTDQNILKALKIVEEVMAKDSFPGIKGLHLEGPYISKEKCGAHDPDLIRSLDRDMLDSLCDFGTRGVLKIITVAPESVTPEQITSLAASNIRVSLGHTNAEPEAIEAAVNSGASLVTHLFNGMPPLMGRRPSLVGRTFTDPRLAAGIIPDMVHVHPLSIKAAAIAMGNRLFAVTDATMTEITDAGETFLGNRRVIIKNGVIRTESGSLAGSAVTMEKACENLARVFDLEAALSMCSELPARAAGFNVGSITPGQSADFTVLTVLPDGKLFVRAAFIGGQCMFKENG